MEFFNKRNKPPENKPKENWRIREWFSDISDDEDSKLKFFNSELIKYNSVLSLVSEKTLPLADAIHFSDCIMGCREIVKDAQPKSIVDIGSGNGFPSLVMAILFPSIKVIVLERDTRKSEFLKSVSSQIGLKNFEVQLASSDGSGMVSCDLVMMRAFIPISKAILALRKQVKKGGHLYMFKSEEWATEVANIPSQLCSFWTPSLVSEYRLPIGEVKFAVIKLKKIAD